MSTVKQRTKQVKQPRGGYAPLKLFDIHDLDDSITLNEIENVHSSIVGAAIDYLSRILFGTNKRQAFEVSFKGAYNLNKIDMAESLLSRVINHEDDSIVAACKLAGFDSAYRAGISAYKPVEEINPDTATIENIRVMLSRVKTFIHKFGPVIQDGIRFEGAYTDIITDGDADFLTEDTLWDLKVIKANPDSKQTLQVLVYYLMGDVSNNPLFKKINKVGIFNPRLNKVYILEVFKLGSQALDDVLLDVIGFEK